MKHFDLEIEFVDDPSDRNWGWGYSHERENTSDTRPLNRTRRCSLCGLLGTNRTTHPQHGCDYERRAGA